MKESIEAIEKVITWYVTAKHASPHDLMEAMRVISSYLYTLETERAEYKKQYEQIIFDEKANGNSVASATNKAEVEVPELYYLRRIMEAAYRNLDSIRTQISFIKHEQSHLKTD